MLRRSQRLLPISCTLMAAALAAATPVARWCPIAWEDVDLAAYATCASGFSPAASECATRVAAAPCSATRAGSPAPAACPMSAAESCPMRAAAAHPATPSHAGPPHSRAATTHGRAYCLDDPGMANATRGESPALVSPLAHAAVLQVLASLAPPRPVIEHSLETARARPPNEPRSAPHPIRGPPSLLG